MSEDYRPSYKFASIYLRGRGLNPDEVTKALGILPSMSHKRGDKRNDQHKWTRSIWSLTSRDNVQSEDLSVHLEWLLNQFEPVKSQLIEILQRDGVVGQLSCFWTLQSGNEELTLSPKLISMLTTFGLELNLDIYSQ